MTRQELLAELSTLLSVRITSVSQGRFVVEGNAMVASRKPQWWLGFESARLGTSVGTPIGPSGSVRNPRLLNLTAERLGRPRTLRRLTAEDGHAAIRLLHAIFESED